MANRKNNISDNKVKKASGGGTKYNEDIKEWGVYDDDDPYQSQFAFAKDRETAQHFDNYYRAGKFRGYEQGKKEGYEKGYLQGRLDSGNHDIDV